MCVWSQQVGGRVGELAKLLANDYVRPVPGHAAGGSGEGYEHPCFASDSRHRHNMRVSSLLWRAAWQDWRDL